MITDCETNFIYFSSLLTTQEQYRPFWQRLKDLLEQENISYGLLEGTKDIWCRDYMPVQVSENAFVQFQFWPSYLDTAKYRHTRTTPSEVAFTSKSPIALSSLKLDGGNVVASKTKAIVTERVFKENPDFSKEEVSAALKEALQVDELYFIPSQPYDFTGHADGMVRFLDEQRLLVNDFRRETPSWQKSFSRALKKTGLEIITFPYVYSDERNEQGDYTAKGCYINFAQVGSKILLPFFDFPEDAVVLQEVKRLFPDCSIHPILSNEIANSSGVLNCASWNIKV